MPLISFKESDRAIIVLSNWKMHVSHQHRLRARKWRTWPSDKYQCSVCTCALSKLSSAQNSCHMCCITSSVSKVTRRLWFPRSANSIQHATRSNVNWCSTSSHMKVGLHKQQTVSDNCVSALFWSLELEGGDDKEVLRILCRKVEAAGGN